MIFSIKRIFCYGKDFIFVMFIYEVCKVEKIVCILKFWMLYNEVNFFII